MKSRTDFGGRQSAVGGRLSAVRGRRVMPRAIGMALAVVAAAALSGCRQDMHDQPKYRPLRGTAFFADGSSARPLIEGTVARGTLQENDAFFTGKTGNARCASCRSRWTRRC